MGWWQQDAQGHSFGDGVNADGTEMLWGDGPADAMADALDSIATQYQAEWGRPPTKAELQAGLLFALGGKDGDVYPAPSPQPRVMAEVVHRGLSCMVVAEDDAETPNHVMVQLLVHPPAHGRDRLVYTGYYKAPA